MSMIPPYHEDFTSLSSSVLYANAPATDEAALPRSRSVILRGLPQTVSLPQIVDCLYAQQGIVQVRLFNDFSSSAIGNLAYIDFVYAHAAKAFVDSAHIHPLTFYGQDHASIHDVEVVIVPTVSSGYGWRNDRFLEQQQSRRIVLSCLSRGWVWLFVSALDLSNVVFVSHREDREQLVVEFASLSSADQARNMLNFHLLPLSPLFADMQIKFEEEACEKDIALRTDTPVPYRKATSDTVAAEFNCYPYNLRIEIPPVRPEHTKPPCGPSLLTELERMAVRLDCDKDEAEYFLEHGREDSMGQATRSYRIIGSSITLTRRRWGWSIPLADEIKLLSVHTLHEPEWRKSWDTYFETMGMPNWRRWEEYGALVRSRELNKDEEEEVSEP